jgi:ATP-dependent Lon protease
MIPLCENNYNSCELGPRSTGKSHLYKEVSPNSILVSGGQTTVANLFYNLASRQVGLVGLYDVVAFDEVAGISFHDKDGIQIMKDYMASGSFARGKSQISAYASMVFVGNINQSVESLVKTSHLLAPFPEAMIDTAFFDRFHAYIPGWEIPKFSPENFTNRYGFIVDYLAEWLREMRKRNFGDAIDKYFKLGNNLKQRDVQGVRKTVSGLLKLLFPDGSYGKADVEDALVYALRVRRRVKEQLKKIGGMEFFDVHFSYIDQDTLDERFVSLPEQGGSSLVAEDILSPGHLYMISGGAPDRIGVFKLELQSIPGNGKLIRTGVASAGGMRDSINIALNYFKANAHRVSGSIHPDNSDFLLQLLDLQGAGTPDEGGLALFISLCSATLKRSVQPQLAVFGEMTLGGTINPVSNLAASLQVAFDAGVKRILLPMASAADLTTVPPELFTKFQTSFYNDPIDAVFKALAVN